MGLHFYTKFKAIRTDIGGEFQDKRVGGFNLMKGTIHQRTVQYSRQENGDG